MTKLIVVITVILQWPLLMQAYLEGVDPTAAAVLLAKQIVQQAQQRGAAQDKAQAESMRTAVGAQLC